MKQENKKVELLKPKYDVVFQALFQGNKENITESLISDIIGEKVEILEIKTDDTLLREYINEKVGRLDLRTKFKDGTICQIEMQLTNQKNIIDRLLYYWSKTFSRQLKRGETFTGLEKTIGIVITDFEIKEMEGIEKLNTKWQIMETEEGKRILTNKLELRIIEIPKAKRVLEKEENNRIAQWLTFIDNPNTERVEEIVKENEEVKKARDLLYVMSEDEKLQRLAELKERAILEELSFKEEIEESWKEIKKSRKEVEESRREVEESKKEVEESKKEVEESKKEVEESRREVEESKRELVRKMKNKNFKIQEIIETTGLTKEEIEKI